MHTIEFLLALLTIIPGARGAVKAAKEPPEHRSISAVLGIALITIFSTGMLAVVSFFYLLQ